MEGVEALPWLPGKDGSWQVIGLHEKHETNNADVWIVSKVHANENPAGLAVLTSGNA